MGRNYLLLILCGLGLFACTAEGGKCLTSAGRTTTVSIGLSEFRKLTIRDKFSVEYHAVTSGNYRCELTSGEKLVGGLLPTINNDGSCLISNRHSCNWLRSYKDVPKLLIYGPSLDTLLYEGAGTFSYVDTLEPARTIYLISDQANGNIRLHLAKDSVFIKQRTGPADVTAVGSCNFAYIYNATEGFSKLWDMKCSNIHFVHEGYALNEVNPDESGIVELYGRGDLLYPEGIPCQLRRKGAGNLITKPR